MPKIEKIEIKRHSFRLPKAFIPSWDTKPREIFEAVIVQVHAGGHVGIGSGDEMIGFNTHENLFIGQDATDIERHHRVLSHISFHYSRCWPLEAALWDLKGKIEGKPVWQMLGGKTGRVRLYASSGVLREAEALAEQARCYKEAGFEAMKIRFHRTDWRDDIKALETVRHAMGDDFKLMVDCNQGWRMPWDPVEPWQYKDALPVLEELKRLGIFWMEEPLFRADYDGMRRLREAAGTDGPLIAGGEMNRELYEFDTITEKSALDVYQPDCVLTGGIYGLAKVAQKAMAAGHLFTPHTWSNGLGFVANAQLYAGVGGGPFLEYPYDPPEWGLDGRDFMIETDLSAKDGWLDLGDAPGLGVTLKAEFS